MKKLIFAIIAVTAILAGCNKSDLATTKGGPGRLSVKITDDPFNINSVESATVTITKIEIRKAGANDGDPFIELLIDPVTIDLFQLRNGITEELVDLEVPQGDYDLVRLYVDDANLKIKEIAEPFRMKVPSGEQTGIKVFIEPGIHVEGGISAELLLDFDLSKSFVMRGKMAHNGFIFKPCIRASNNSTAGRIEGYVKDAANVTIEEAKVFAIHGTDTVTTLTAADGFYALVGLPADTYSMFATKNNFDTANIESIVVIPGNRVVNNFVLVPSIPKYLSSVIENETPAILEMTYNLILADIVPDVSAFTVTVNSVARSVTSVTIAENKVLLTLSSAVIKDDVVTVAYTIPATNPIQTDQGAQAATFSAEDVTNKAGI
jgi:uncharacterized repeat protein (TIGR02059 family)